MFPYPDPPTGYVATVEEVAERLSIEDVTALTATQRARILAGLQDSAADVVLALDRPILPVDDTKTGLTPAWGQEPLTWQAWPGVWDDEITVKTAVQQPDGTYTVTVGVGIDGRAIPDIRRFVIVHAVESIRNDPNSDMGKRLVSSLSAEGQSVSYSDQKGSRAYANPVRTAGSLPRMEDLQRKYRKRLYSTVVRPAQAPWPSTGPYIDPRSGTAVWW